MTKPSFKMLAGATVSVAVLAFLTLPANAGFEWRGSQPSAPAASAAAAPQGDDLNGLEPVMSWDGSPSMPAQKVAPVETAPISANAPMPLVPSANRLPISAPVIASGEPGEIVNGFGSDLPLAIALPQVTPPGYQYAFAPNVNAGERISWDGGKPWKNVLAEALADKGLGYELHENTIRIVRGPTKLSTVSDASDAGMQTIAVTPPAMPQSRINGNAAASAPNVPMGEPVTIRRQKPSLLARKNKKTTDVIVPTVPPSDLSEAQMPTSSGPMPADDMSWAAPADDAKPVALASAPAAAPIPAPAPVSAPVSEPVFAPEAPMPLTPPPAMPPSGLTAAESLTALPSSEPMAIAAPIPALPPEMSPSAKTPVAAAPVAAEKSAGWQATRGETLREVLTAWSQQANVELYWSIDYDYKILKNFDSNKSFEEAVGTLLEQFTQARPQPYGQLHQNSKGPRVLVIRSYDLAD